MKHIQSHDNLLQHSSLFHFGGLIANGLLVLALLYSLFLPPPLFLILLCVAFILWVMISRE